MLLGLNGLRCGELIATDVTDVSSHSWHHTLAFRTTKGDKPTVVALASPTMQAIEAAIDGRSSGPLLRNSPGRRMTPYNVQYLLAALARDTGIAKQLTPTDCATAPSRSDSTPASPCVTCGGPSEFAPSGSATNYRPTNRCPTGVAVTSLTVAAPAARAPR